MLIVDSFDVPPDEENVVSFIFEWIAGKDNPKEEPEGFKFDVRTSLNRVGCRVDVTENGFCLAFDVSGELRILEKYP
uniref:Uncharacterized protein n=1 Tax=Pseudothermotoga hypogea TaxID=57487 RepID=A0A832I530_9THEM